MARKTWLAGGLLLIATVVVTPRLAAQRNPRDISGTYSFSTITPLQRPDALAGKETLSEEEAVAFEKSENTRLNRDLFDPEKGQPSAGYPARADGGVLSYNEFWYERGSRLTRDKRTSLISDPPDGKIPFNDAARARVAANRRWSDSGMGDSYEERPLSDRCLQGFNSGPPMTPGAYNNNVQIVQGPGYVAIINEMVHNARLVPLDGRPHVNTKIRQWSGDSRGHWEGDTLVVETSNFRRETSLQGSTSQTKVVERFTKVEPDVVRYEFTVTDPTSYTRPWTAMVPLVRMKEPLLEYGCHEGNYALPNILAGARVQEKLPANGVTP